MLVRMAAQVVESVVPVLNHGSERVAGAGAGEALRGNADGRDAVMGWAWQGGQAGRAG